MLFRIWPPFLKHISYFIHVLLKAFSHQLICEPAFYNNKSRSLYAVNIQNIFNYILHINQEEESGNFCSMPLSLYLNWVSVLDRYIDDEREKGGCWWVVGVPLQLNWVLLVFSTHLITDNMCNSCNSELRKS